MCIDCVSSKMRSWRRVFGGFYANTGSVWHRPPFDVRSQTAYISSASAVAQQSNFGYRQKEELQTSRELVDRGFWNISNFLDILVLDISCFTTLDKMMFTSLNADCDASSRCSTASSSGESDAYYSLNQTQVFTTIIINNLKWFNI